MFSHIVWGANTLDFGLRIWEEAVVANETEKNDPLGNSRIDTLENHKAFLGENMRHLGPSLF